MAPILLIIFVSLIIYLSVLLFSKGAVKISLVKIETLITFIVLFVFVVILIIEMFQ